MLALQGGFSFFDLIIMPNETMAKVTFNSKYFEAIPHEELYEKSGFKTV